MQPNVSTTQASSPLLLASSGRHSSRANNLHRNVIFREGAEKAGQVVPYTTQAPVGSTDPLDLYAYLENYEAKTGGSALALAHNGNLSNGIMFPVDKQYTGRKLDRKYVESRARWEPMYEITQIKGDGEAHPLLSPDDAFADYETWDAGNLDLSVAKSDDMLQYEYAREALKNGLLLEKRLGTNPYKFGLIGSTDSHTGLTAVEEENFFGKATNAEPKPERMMHPFTRTEAGVFEGYETGVLGLIPASGPRRTHVPQSGTPCNARKSTAPLARGFWSVSLAAGTTRWMTSTVGSPPSVVMRRACPWVAT